MRIAVHKQAARAQVETKTRTGSARSSRPWCRAWQRLEMAIVLLASSGTFPTPWSILKESPTILSLQSHAADNVPVLDTMFRWNP